jgi:hypothetical protein
MSPLVPMGSLPYWNWAGGSVPATNQGREHGRAVVLRVSERGTLKVRSPRLDNVTLALFLLVTTLLTVGVVVMLIYTMRGQRG